MDANSDIFTLIEQDAPLPLLTYAFTNTPDLNKTRTSRPYHSYTPFMYAVANNKYSIVEHMLRYNATLKAKLGTLAPETSLFNTGYVTPSGETAMLEACFFTTNKMLSLLLEHNVPLPEFCAQSPLMECVMCDDVEKLKLFAKYGIDLDTPSLHNITGLQNHPAIVREQLRYSPLAIAYLYSSFGSVEYLLSKGASATCSLSIIGGFNHTLFRYVCGQGDHAMTLMFIENMTRFDGNDGALLCACLHKNASLEVVKKLVSKGKYNVNQKYLNFDDRGNTTIHTPLYSACYRGHDEIVRYLLECGATDDINEVIKRVKYDKSSNVDVIVEYINNVFSWFKN